MFQEYTQVNFEIPDDVFLARIEEWEYTSLIVVDATSDALED
jgi:hypothetical protein